MNFSATCAPLAAAIFLLLRPNLHVYRRWLDLKTRGKLLGMMLSAPPMSLNYVIQQVTLF